MIREGVVVFFNKLRGFGSICSNHEIFAFVARDVKGAIYTFNEVTFLVKETLSGKRAYEIKLLIRNLFAERK
ncbi:MAG: cold-shock protein [Flavobacterium sp.]|nr:MAG: cold-shock protein [Flavobacterium sp.]